MNRYSQSELLQSVLAPLLKDFIDWFERALALLEDRDLPTLTTEEQADLLARVCQAKQEVEAAIALFEATARQVGVDPTAIAGWHRLVAECWRVSIDYRASLPRE
ncbi:MAG: DUF2605 domain-containing protein [Cyanobacteria bacterium P01_A01_bin.135]